MSFDIDTKWDEIVIEENSMPIYVAKPQGEGAYPCVIVLQEIFGVNHHIRDVADRVAAEGYIAIAPDLFYREGKRFECSYTEMDKAFEQAGKFNNDNFLTDIDALLSSIRKRGDLKNNLITTLGFCLGGQLSYLAACTKNITSAICFYGGKIMTLLDKTSGIDCPIILFFGGKDPYIPTQDVEYIKTALEDNNKQAKIHIYDNADHGFFCNERGNYNEIAAKDSWEKTKSFLKTTLVLNENIENDRNIDTRASVDIKDAKKAF